MRVFQRREYFRRKQFAVFFQRADTGLHALPFDRYASCFYRLDGRIGYFGPDAVSGNKSYLMSHYSYYKVGVLCGSVRRKTALRSNTVLSAVYAKSLKPCWRRTPKFARSF